MGPIDGHNLDELVKNLEFAKQCDSPILLHVLTKKGHGLEAARNFPERFHGLGAFDPVTGESRKPSPGTPPAFQDVFGQALVRFARQDPRIVGITAAMPSGTGLAPLAAELPRQFFDVGIAEEHAVLFAAGLATQGFRPVLLRFTPPSSSGHTTRSFTTWPCRSWPVTFWPRPGGALCTTTVPTHHGPLRPRLPTLRFRAPLMQPKDEDELVDMLQYTSLQAPRVPAFLRPGSARRPEPGIEDQGAARRPGPPSATPRCWREGSNKSTSWALGPMVQLTPLRLAAWLWPPKSAFSVGVVNARFVKPLDRLLLSHAAVVPLLVTMEDHVLSGGFGSAGA